MQTSPPDNGQYMVAAYIVTGVVYLGYAMLLWVKGRKADR